MSNEAENKLMKFMKAALPLIDKEFELDSMQQVVITCNIEDEDNPLYLFQYGIPSSVFVTVKPTDEGIEIINAKVTAPAADEDFIDVTLLEQKEIGLGVTMTSSMGSNLGHLVHETLEAINDNPNALAMLHMATKDLETAKVLGPERACVPRGQTRIPAGSSIAKRF